MIFELMIKSLRKGKVRFACAVLGVAVATGAVVFMTSLVAANRAQAPTLALKSSMPWKAWKIEGVKLGFGRGPRASGARKDAVGESVKTPRGDLELSVLSATVDYRPGGHVMQGPPMMALIASAPEECPYDAVKLARGRWVNGDSSEAEVVCVVGSMRRFGTLEEPPLGSVLKFVGAKGTLNAKVVGYLDGGKLPRQFPYVFANAKAFAGFAAEKHGRVTFWRNVPSGCREGDGILTAESESVLASFTGDEQRRMDYATPLLLVAAFLTALSLLVNSLLLSVEANRSALAILRTVGLTRAGVVKFVSLEACFSSLVGWVVGVIVSAVALYIYIVCDPVAFPVGVAYDVRSMIVTLFLLPVISFFAVLFALRPALKVRPLDSASTRPRSGRHGMALTFALGFSAFVAVEVWGASLMRAFIPSAEWPDAIVSILPGGVAGSDFDKLGGIEGVKRISELYPLQIQLADAPAGRNALLLGADWLPRFKFLEGDWEAAEKSVMEEGAVVITEMMSNAHGLHKGDELALLIPRRGEAPEKVMLPVAGVVDLNWHMVTSRGLVRGMNGMPVMTDGAVFASPDTVVSLHSRPINMVMMTHLWLDYKPEFLARHGVFPAGRIVEREIAKRLGDGTGSTVRLHARDEIADGTLAHGSDLIGQAARVPFVFLAILAIGFVAMLVSETEARRNEFVVLRTIGATRGQLVIRLASSAVKTALIGIVTGLPIGALSGWLCTFKTGNWPGLPHWFVLPIDVVTEGACGAVVFALLFSVPASLALVGRFTERGTR